MNNIYISDDYPTSEEYMELRTKVEWYNTSREAVDRGLTNSNFCCILRDNQKLVGMGRIVGDGVFTFFIVDIIIHPDYQGLGLGKKIMNRIISFLDENASENAYITLLAAEGKESFYKKFGFIERPIDGYGAGMMLKLKK